MKVQMIRLTDQADSSARKRVDEMTELKAELRKGIVIISISFI
jgi:hypothetical protein